MKQTHDCGTPSVIAGLTRNPLRRDKIAAQARNDGMTKQKRFVWYITLQDLKLFTPPPC